ncbi:MAG: hypothetical protein R3C68_16015 [Myxococcota bacterium]
MRLLVNCGRDKALEQAKRKAIAVLHGDERSAAAMLTLGMVFRLGTESS